MTSNQLSVSLISGRRAGRWLANRGCGEGPGRASSEGARL